MSDEREPQPRERRRHAAERRDLAGRLAPPEETAATGGAARPDRNGGAIRVGTGQVTLARDLVDERGETEHVSRPEPVVIVITLLALAFIAFIAWQVAQMPAPAK